MKYIIYGDPCSGETPTPILFPNWLSHKVEAEGKNVTSAGFVEILFDESERRISCRCYGFSESLNMAPKNNDNIIIACSLRQKSF